MIEDAEKSGNYDSGAINGAKGKLTSAKNNLRNAKDQYDKGHYKQAYEKAIDAIERAEDAEDHLEDFGNNTDDADDSEDDEDNDSETDNETAEEDQMERNLRISTTINGQDASGSSEDNPVKISGDSVDLVVVIENTGSADIEIDKVEITTTTLNTQVSEYELSGGVIPAGTKVEFSTTLDRGLLGAIADTVGTPTYKTHVEIKLDGNWDYEIDIYWQLV